jgi:Family of unknown function (DUF5714)
VQNLTDKCEICEKNLQLITEHDDYQDTKCVFCEKIFNTNIICPDGHYICDDCHAADAITYMKDYCLKTDEKNPYLIIDHIMHHPSFKMYGNEHHAMTAAAIVTAIKNSECANQKGTAITNKHIIEAINRAKKVPGGWCGFFGACGAAIGSGVAVSVIMGATPSTAVPRSAANLTTAKSLTKIADDLEHCCKRSMKYSIQTALDQLSELLNCKLEFEMTRCTFSGLNSKCVYAKCPFF